MAVHARLIAQVRDWRRLHYNDPAFYPTGDSVHVTRFRLWPLALLPLVAVSAEIAAPDRAQIRALHTDVIVPASDALIEAEREIPGTDHHWHQLEGIAQELAKAGDKLIAVGEGKLEKGWAAHATRLKEESAAIARAAATRKHQDIVSGNGRLLAVCDACHAGYKGSPQ
jgi:hypothetical protein